MEDATWGPLEAIISKAGKTIAIISAIIAILKLLDKYGIETWNSEPKQKKREKEETTENEP